MKKIISHNSWSYLPVRQWWLKPFAWMARCQDIRAGLQSWVSVEGFDIRVRFDKYGAPHFAHGLIEYDGDVYWHLRLNLPDKRVARVTLETTPFMSCYQRAKQKELFWIFCDYLANTVAYKNVTFYGGWPRDEWRQKAYEFGTKEPDVTEMHGSVSGNKLNCLRLKSWARTHNREIIENAKTEWVMLDFIEYK